MTPNDELPSEAGTHATNPDPQTSPDYCTKKVKSQYAVWPSARASQAVAKCRKERGDVRKGEEEEKVDVGRFSFSL